MGLDMYLEKIHRDVDGYRDVDLNSLDKDSDLYRKLEPYIMNCGEYIHWLSLFEEVAYWRKANAVHNWFVENVQNNVDDCGVYEVTKEQLATLRDICNTIIDKVKLKPGQIKNGRQYIDGQWVDCLEEGVIIENPEICEELLPSVEGFFFGSTEYDQFYLEDVKDTARITDDILNTINFDEYKIYYHSSW